MNDEICAVLVDLARKRKNPSEPVRRHIHAPKIHLYVRIGPRACNGQALQALVLADVNVRADQQRQGVFSTLLSRLEHEVPTLGLQAVVVENVVNQYLRQYLERQGYMPIRAFPDSLYKAFS